MNILLAAVIRSKNKQAFISFITFLSMAGVTVGVMALIIVIAVMAGAESYFTTQILGVESHIVIRRHGGTISDYKTVMEKVLGEPGVRSAAPFVYSQVMLRSASGISGSVLRGIDPRIDGSPIKGYDKAGLIEKIRPQITDTSGVRPPGIVLGRELAVSINCVPGDTIYLISPEGHDVPHRPHAHHETV
ncbi:MAG: ABC transporter permease [Desulfobacterales bacterium]